MQTTRTRLKEAALQLFLQRGYAGTSIGAIETAAGLAPRAGGFYRHFVSKNDLVLAIAKEDLIEQQGELGFAGLLPLGDTRAELLLIARGYLKANARQARYYALIEEVRRLPEIAALEKAANAEIFSWLKKWVASKKAARDLSAAALGPFTLTVFGGILFYTSKKLQGVTLKGLTDARMIEDWATYWSGVLDKPRQ